MKNLIKKWYFWVIIVVITLGIIGMAGTGESVDNDVVSTTIATTTIETTTEVITTEQTEDYDAIIKTLTNITELNFGSIPNTTYEITFDEELKAYTVDITCIGIADDLTNCIIYNQMNDWKTLVSNVSDASKSCTEMIQTTMDSDYVVIQNLYDIVDGKKTRLISCKNGTVLFDMATAMNIDY